MKNKIITFCALNLGFLLFSTTILAKENNVVSEINSNIFVESIKVKPLKKHDYTFENLDLKNLATTSEFNEIYLLKNFVLDSITNDQILMAKAVMDDLETSQNYIDLI